MNRSIATAGALASALLFATAAMAQAGPVPEAYYPPDVVAAVRALTDRADALGWHLNGAPDPSHCYHFQGIARSHGPGTPYMFVSKSGNHPGVLCLQWCSDLNVPCTEVGDGPGHLYVVRMASRSQDGERLRSNRIVRNTESADSVPAAEDVVARAIAFDGTNGWPDYGHIGGMQMVGDVLAIALETPYDPNDVADNVNRVLFVDVRDPENPRPLSSAPIVLSSGFGVGTVAVAPQPSGRYLMIVTGKENQLIRVYESVPDPNTGVTDLRSPGLTWELKDNWRPADAPVDPPCWSIPPNPYYPNGLSWGWPSGGWDDYAHQSHTFVREGGPTGQLYLIGSRNSNAAPLLGDDMLDVYQVRWDGTTFGLGCVAQKHLYAHPSSDGALLFHNKIADFAAGGGVHVSPSGELIFYATEHDNDGPGGTVKAGEWRHRDMVRPGSPTLDPSAATGGPYAVPEGGTTSVTATPALPATKAWVELWTDDDWEDDRYLVIDYDDRFRDNFDDFEELDDAKFNPLADGFGDQATSARWMSPPGCDIHLNRDHTTFGNPPLSADNRRTVGGEGEPRGVRHLSNIEDDDGDGGMNDSISSVIFQPGCDAYYDPAVLEVAWDLDGDLAFESAGRTVTFSAAFLDGPTAAAPLARVRHPFDGRTGTAAAEVQVFNVPPALASLSIRDGAGREVSGSATPTLAGLPLKLAASFTDPGFADTQTASVDWADGVVSQHGDLDAFTGATGGVTGQATEGHTYLAPSEYPVLLHLADDDGGVTDTTTTVKVLDARGAILEVIARIDALLAGSTGAARDAWLAARDLLDGNTLGAPHNGAIDKLDAGDREAAVRRLEQAIAALRYAESVTGADTDDMQALLALAAQAISAKAQADAIAANSPPTSGEARQLAKIQSYLDAGAASLAGGDWLSAASSFREAVRLAVALL